MQLDISEAVQLLLDSASAKEKFDKAVERLTSVPPPEVVIACMQALHREPKAHLIRLQLAKLLLQLNSQSFAIEQLKVIKLDSNSEALVELIEKLERLYANNAEQQVSATLASLDFDIELLDSDKD